MTNTEPVLKATPKGESLKNDEVELSPKEEMSEFAKTIVIAVLLAMVIRTFLYEPFNIPSGSMLPTLEVGDYLFVSKPSYGYSKYSFPLSMGGFDGRVMDEEPKRGDIIVFRQPNNTSVDYIKRLVALPGETVQMIRGRLYINGKRVERETVGLVQSDENTTYQREVLTEYIETLPGGIMHTIYETSDNEALDNTPLYTIPDDHYFLMGDNRDNSRDSRDMMTVGFVPYENLIGRADLLFFSIDKDSAKLFNPFTWPGAIRISRIFKSLKPVRPEE